MGRQNKFHRKLVLYLVACLLLSCLAWTQAQTAQQGPSSPTQPTPQENKAKPSQSQNSSSATKPPAETRISPQEAEELFRSVDEILKFASHDTDLPIHEQVKRRLVNRDEVVAYLEKHMAEDEDAQRLKRSEVVLKKFGLLPHDFDLGKFLIALLREQVAGYYDSTTKTVNLLDWVEAEQQKPVLAHELTHALQDQSFGLEKWMKAGVTNLALTKRDLTPRDIEDDELQDARQAVVEGQAMAVLIDYMLAPTGQSLLSSPELVEALKQGMLVGAADSVEFRNAPVFLQEVLTFPYRYGLDFVGQVMAKGGKDKAFAAAFKNPPRTTRQIMQPHTYLSGERIEPLPLPDFTRLMKNYDRFDVGSMGEFDVALLVNQYADPDASHHLYPEWRGGYYYAARPKGDPGAPLALLYVSRWAAPKSAAEFAAIYYGSLKKRYRSLRAVAQTGKAAESLPPTVQSLTGNHEWLTEEGDVVISVEGETVFISESLDDVTSNSLRSATFSKTKAFAAAGK